MPVAAIAYALISAALFGASTPLAKMLLGEVPPLALAGLLYLGSGLGLLAWIAVRPAASRVVLARSEWPWLGAAIVTGGVIAPALLVFGLARTDGAAASLLLNLEAALTAAIAWIAFRENVDRRVFIGMLAVVAGGAVLSWQQVPRAGGIAGPLLIAGACLGWALDNNFTRRVSGGDAATIACLKGLIAGAATLALALAQGAVLPRAGAIAAAALGGRFAYGITLALFIVALRQLGPARPRGSLSLAALSRPLVRLAIAARQAEPQFWRCAPTT